MKNYNYIISIFLILPIVTTAQYKGGTGSGETLTAINSKHLTNWFQIDGNWSEAGNWADGIVPTTTEEVNIIAVATLDNNYTYPVVNISPGGVLTIPGGFGLTVSGSVQNSNGTAGIVLQSGSSLIHDNANVMGSMERQVANADWSSNLDGWHLLSSPVENQLLSNGGFTSPEYDFFSWRENTNEWLNQKDGSNNITSFEPGKGYLVAYDDGGTKTFAGILNVNGITLTNLSRTGSSFYIGYHLLGNPFPSALKWNDGNWALMNVSGVASVWNKSAQNYLSLSNPDDIIPANQGFFIQVNDATNSLKIPTVSRVHSNVNFYKETPADFMKLKITNTANETFDETVVRLKADASTAYDFAYDGHKLQGSEIAPMLYTVIQPGEYASVNTFSNTDVPASVEMGFRPGVASNYTIRADEYTFNRQIVLEDRLTGTTKIVDGEFSYAFDGNPGDAENRFLLHFSPLGVPENGESPEILIYALENSVYLNSPFKEKGEVQINTMSGQLVYKGGVASERITIIDTNGFVPGIYLVKAIIGDKSIVQKVLIQ